MRLRLAIAAALCLVLTAQAFGAQTFPYTAHVSTDDVYVRSGPGRSYYPTGKLKMGDKVEVYRHDPGGWYAIRPVEGSYSWVSGRFLELGQDAIATVTGDRVAARVGSQFSDIRDVIQVPLHRGELVEVLDKKESGAEPGSGTWYKIAPPSGEFRWVFGKYVDPDYLQSGVRKAPAGRSPLVAPGASSADADAAPVESASLPAARDGRQTAGPSAGQVRTAEHWATSDAPSQRSPQRTPSEPNAAAAGQTDQSEAQPSQPVTNQFVDPPRDPSGTPTLRRLSPQEFQREVDDINMELSIMIAEEPTVWKLDDLAIRARALLTQAETAVQRGRVRLVVNKIAQSDDIKRRYDAVNSTYAATERHNRQLAGLSRIRDRVSREPALEGRFDGVGRLVQVVPSKLGAPRFALVDQKGHVHCYVTPAPGVNMDYFVGRQIGISGIRGYMAEQRARHVMAKHVRTLDGRRFR